MKMHNFEQIYDNIVLPPQKNQNKDFIQISIMLINLYNNIVQMIQQVAKHQSKSMDHSPYLPFQLKYQFEPQQLPDDYEVLRIFLVGLPYSGLEQVAQILNKEYGCKIFDIKMEDKPKDMPAVKYIRQSCYKEFRQTPKAVILSQYSSKIILDIKKRNYLNVVLVEATFRTRLNNFLKQNNKQEDLASIQQFIHLDQTDHNSEYDKCLQYIRARVINRGNDQLEKEVKAKQKQIIRYFRPTWDQYFMKMADIARRRSNCMKASVGAVIVNDQNRVISTGYNGTPKGITSCYKMGCQRCNNNEGKQLDQCLCLHAEQSAIIEVGINKTQGCRLYTTYYPCFSCAKIIKQAGIKKIYYMDEYEKQDSGKPFIQEYFMSYDVVQIFSDNLYY